MSKARVDQRISDYGASQTETLFTDSYYDDLLQEVGELPIVVKAELVDMVKNTGVYTLPQNAVGLMRVFYDDVDLPQIGRRDLDAISLKWRDESGKPQAYVTEAEGERFFRLYPKPDRDSASFVPLFGEPFGRDFPQYAAATLQTEGPNDMPDWMDLPLSFGVLAQEFSRDSAHQDYAYAGLCQRLSVLLLRMGL